MRIKSYSIPTFILVLIISFLLIVVLSILAPVFFPIDLGATKLTARLLPPSFMEGGKAEFFLGTDNLGRDFMIRLFYGTRNSLFIAFAGLVISAVLGTLLGVLTGLYKGLLDSIVSFLVDVKLSIPSLIISIVCASVFGSSKLIMILIIGLTGYPSFTRLARGQTIQLKEANFMESSRALGASKLRIVFEHVLSNISSPMIVHATMKISSFILLESSLSFLGLGIQPPDVSLGLMVSAGRDYLISSWWLSIIPSVVIVLIVVQVSMIGDWLRDQMDPKLKNS
ncbi:ABC transporter permease [Cohnella lupini]|uniref:Peptide/nickel transport system permease protein n=1 Tax=Cohnella lupini TaxID=1294267 RepID=A0A3D9I1U7_9BACL|nr:ABC transporter permease [Cohnella lupini]RED55748.1 peptide/nickel transport system permease protein [Cohnella lupini]